MKVCLKRGGLVTGDGLAVLRPPDGDRPKGTVREHFRQGCQRRVIRQKVAILAVLI